MATFDTIFYVTTLICMVASQRLTVTIPDQGTIIGKDISMIRTQRINAFLGIPYAQPPLVSLRFSPPDTSSLPSWGGVRNATEFMPGCMQTETSYQKDQIVFLKLFPNEKLEMSEDCLYLNVFVPYEGFAVMVWLHTGNFSAGNPAIWNPYTLVFKQRVIVVTFAFRLNILGFFTTGDGEAPGNFGLLDQVAALQWVKKNIKLFGGNPDNICLFGHGSGAVSASLHLLSTYSQNLFHKAIIMSGNALLPTTITDPQADIQRVFKAINWHFGCDIAPTSKLMQCLRLANPEILVNSISPLSSWGPIVDTLLRNTSKPVIAEDPRNSFDNGDFMQVPILTGYTEMENAFELEELDIFSDDGNVTLEQFETAVENLIKVDITGEGNTSICSANKEHIMDTVLFYYRPTIMAKKDFVPQKVIIDMATEKIYGSTTFLQADLISQYVDDVYVYRFDHKVKTEVALEDYPSWVTAPHYFDLIYIWGLPYWSNKLDWDSGDKLTSDILMNLWTNFAKSSNPTKSSIYPIKWDKFSSSNPKMLIIDRYFNMSDETRVDYKAFEFWNDYFPKVVKTDSGCCNASAYNNFASANVDMPPKYVLLFCTIHILLYYLQKLILQSYES
ncbi:cholinesterase isoform X2 [Chrysoperla carnea]|uniref:cholinesterase isoform X2 n=1 Tax=Chrysoperla carnea TaxID=189513 RepID=UPI001D095126|nr:cholinesterase isoform X2 [Chrysoperla carnea]